MNGILLLNKDINKTSRDIVNDISHILKTKKVGHTGTLDPIATGVLVITVGRYTKLNEVLMSTYKEYIAEFKLGVLTDTLDITGNVLKSENVSLAKEEIKNAIMSFHGSYMQSVPHYSAVKVNGKKLYEYARNGEHVDLPSRSVEIKEIEFISIKDDIVKIRTLVSKGTYIRSLIRDIGEHLNTYATMTSLVRTKQGRFDISSTCTVDDIRNNKYHLLKIEDVLDVFVVEMNEDEYFKVKNGSRMSGNYGECFVLFKYHGKEISLYKKDNDVYRNYLSIDI
ncbi:MAG: tRNA pseudouridine(55) synthase TruB [Bacilli bacterium]|nr:tRNA pseudouridine(55) synthase TruB [Bacilli bacterium]